MMAPPGKASLGAAALAADTISGRENRWLKRFRAALRGTRPDESSIGVEGARLVEEALRSGLAVEALLISVSGEKHLERLRPWLGPAMRLLRTSDKLFAGVADTETPQGVAALVRPRATSFDDLVRGTPLIVVLVGVQDPGNVGTILRSAEAFGATGVAACAIAGAGTANPLAPKALRASAGSALRMPILRGVGLSVLLAQFRVAGVTILATSATRSRLGEPLGTRESDAGPPLAEPWRIDLRQPVALLIGNEGAGLPPEIERSADARVCIPLAAGVESLNAAVAAGVLLYEAARQRGTLGAL